MSKVTSKSSVGVLVYCITSLSSTSCTLSVLVSQSQGKYYSYMSFAQDKQDSSLRETCARGFTQHTHGLFAPSNVKEKKPEMARKMMQAKIQKMEGVLILQNQMEAVYMVPVRRIEADQITKECGFKCAWINLTDLMEQLDSTENNDVSVGTVPLSIVFASMFRTQDNLTGLQDLFDELTNISGNKEKIVLRNEMRQLKIIEEKEEVKTEEATCNYVCKMCRYPLFSNLDLCFHEESDGQLAFSYNKRNEFVTTECTSHFVNGFSWMSFLNVENAAKLTCPNKKCSASIGDYSLSGDQCSCGRWVTPSIKISKKAVDPKNLNNRIAITRPVIMTRPVLKPSQN